jgi:DNA-binding LacI/PurR family transcriptional regulator
VHLAQTLVQQKMSEARIRSRSTLQDVARRAGVSPSTASSALAGNQEHRRISEETCQRVLDAARALLYTPNLLHRSIRRGRTQIISVFNAFRRRDRNDLYLDRLTGAIEEAGGELGYNVLVHTNYKQSLEDIYESLTGGFSDGLVLFGSTADDPLIALLKESTLPTVLVAPRQADGAFLNVVDDVDMGMRLVAEALVAQGHRQIAAITGRTEIAPDPTGRIGRLRQELARLNVSLADDFVLPFYNDVEDAARRFLELKPRPTALFVWHDGNAYRLLEAFESLGLSIPDDLSIIGYDGIVWPSKSSHVIASVAVPIDQMALAGVRMLDGLILGDGSSINQITPVSFHPGTTLGPPPAYPSLQ